MSRHRIGDVAAKVGVETHVLRHWEDVGVLVPARTPNGQRVYDDDLATRALIIRRCQRAGLSLAQIRALAPSDEAQRLVLIAEERERVQAAISQLRETDAYLEHLTECRHPLANECPECSSFAVGAPPARLTRH